MNIKKTHIVIYCRELWTSGVQFYHLRSKTSSGLYRISLRYPKQSGRSFIFLNDIYINIFAQYTCTKNGFISQ